LAVADAGLRHYGNALKAAKKATELDPLLAVAHYNLAILYLVTGDQPMAFEARRQLEGLDQNLADRLATLLRSQFVINVTDLSSK